MKTRYKLALLFIWMAVIFWFSSEGHDASTARSDAIVEALPGMGSWPQGIATFLTRKAAHALIYFVLGVLMLAVVRDYASSRTRAVWISILFVLLYALSDELHQAFVPGRSAELRDVLIDSIAGSIGILGSFFLGTIRLKK
jgi:VanZ family protein